MPRLVHIKRRARSALRIWSDGQRIITLRHHRLQTPRNILTRHLEDQTGPETIPSLFERLITRLTERMSGVIHGFDDLLDEVETALTTTEPLAARKRIRETRQDILILRRYMAPQRDAVSMLHAEPPKWLDETDRLRLRETANRLMQYVEELDAARERAVQQELNATLPSSPALASSPASAAPPVPPPPQPAAEVDKVNPLDAEDAWWRLHLLKEELAQLQATTAAEREHTKTFSSRQLQAKSR